MSAWEPGLSVVEYTCRRDESEDRMCYLFSGEAVGHLLAILKRENLNVPSRCYMPWIALLSFTTRREGAEDRCTLKACLRPLVCAL